MARKIATNRTVDREELLEFIRPRHRGILSTTRRDGRPQMSLVTMGVDTEGRVVIASYPERVKVLNARRDPEASIGVMSDEFNGDWVQVDGTIEVLDLPEALDGLVDYFRVISGEHSDWDEYRQAMTDQGKVLLRLTPQRWGPISCGGFPAHLVD
jgi:PPOX class probable F420-dependent enzyme